MPIDRAEAARIAELARLEIPSGELDRVAAQLSQVLEFVAHLDELDLGGLQPIAFASPDAPLRADAFDGRTLEPGTAAAEAPEAEYGWFIVPPVVENLEP
jgi:aspartyl-tRNA(Asn)/glutamyl-tRNA(Gln) amidotransferase subunit C